MAHSPSSHDPHEAQALGFEPDHINLRGVFGFGIGLAVVTIIVQALMLWMWHIEVARVDAANPPLLYPLAVSEDQRQPPEPRLQTDPKQDLANLRASEDAILNGYSWVDRNNNIVRIPVADAMRLTLERGLPARAPQGAPGTQPATAATGTTATQDRK